MRKLSITVKPNMVNTDESYSIFHVVSIATSASQMLRSSIRSLWSCITRNLFIDTNRTSNCSCKSWPVTSTQLASPSLAHYSHHTECTGNLQTALSAFIICRNKQTSNGFPIISISSRCLFISLLMYLCPLSAKGSKFPATLQFVREPPIRGLFIVLRVDGTSRSTNTPRGVVSGLSTAAVRRSCHRCYWLLGSNSCNRCRQENDFTSVSHVSSHARVQDWSTKLCLHDKLGLGLCWLWAQI